MTMSVQHGARARAGVPPAFWLIGALTALRIGVLALTPLNLHGDEAQYWAWSRSLDWGYYSKPPLIAWTIAATTALFGDGEWAVRLAAPLAQGAAACVLYVLARHMYTPRAAFWAGVGWALMPGVQLSSVIISTDALLLPLWAAALLSLWRLIETGKTGWALALGAAFGLGALAKYAMAYFLIGAALACIFSARARRAVLSRNGVLAGAIALALLAPNLIWNASHSFATIAHTAAGAALGKEYFHLSELAQFLTDQLGVAGPLYFGALIFLFIEAARRRAALSETDRFLLAFAAPALAIITVQALLSRANANWAVVSYPAAMIWVAGRFAQGRGALLLKASQALHGALGVLFISALLSPDFANRMGLANSLKRAREWEQTATLIAQRVEALPQRPSAIMVDNRLMFYDLTYYWRNGAPAPLRMWMLEANPGNSAEMGAPMRAEDSADVFVVMSGETFRELIFDDFQQAIPRGAASVPLGERQKLRFGVSKDPSAKPGEACRITVMLGLHIATCATPLRRDLLFASASKFAPVARDDAFARRAHSDRYE